jgi:hypothetical protein
VRPIEEHLADVEKLTEAEIGEIRSLAAQLDGYAVTVVLGAGASHDCGMRMAGEMAPELRADYEADPGCRPHSTGLTDDLGLVAEAIYQRKGQLAVLEAVGLTNPDLWPPTEQIEDHFCALRVLARLVREHGALRQGCSFNYDCCGEAALRAEGYSLGRETMKGRRWPDHAYVVCNKAMFYDPRDRGDGFELVKVHGCAEHYRQEYAEQPTPELEESIIIRRSQVRSWKGREWGRDGLRGPAVQSVLLLVGFSAQDVAVVEELKDVLEGALAAAPELPRPRVVTIDHEPNTVPLEELVKLGIGPRVPAGAITKIQTASSSTTSVLMMLLAEMIAVKLSSSMAEHEYELPSAIGQRLGLLTVAGPAMARWSFLLGPATPEVSFAQRVNAQEAAECEYVPLAQDADVTVRAMAIRRRLLAALELNEPEDPAALCATHGFVVKSGVGYLPVGACMEDLEAACRDGELKEAREVLLWPRGLECILVCEEDGSRRGMSIERECEVEVP